MSLLRYSVLFLLIIELFFLSVTVISHRATLIDSNRFLVGRAEALGILCRIMIYAQRGRLAEEYLARFYLCLYYALVVDPTVSL
ncbi:unnamed protein product [Schistosoma mattheei]|uniref:Uncharacterized protein n=1 Tax=Schistosoma mattheei TaxID=31246 RepID=A0A183PX66_9TREM|nr:unnamed protein product [Schistosoma mattheei]